MSANSPSKLLEEEPVDGVWRLLMPVMVVMAQVASAEADDVEGSMLLV